MEENKNVPKAKVRVGQIVCTIWENEGKTKEGKPFMRKSVQFEKNYKDGEEWKKTTNLQKSDVPKLILALQKVEELLFEVKVE